MALPATDAFTTGSNQALSTYSASWTESNGAWTVTASTDTVAPTGGNSVNNMAVWDADTFNDNQYSQLKLISIGGNDTGVLGRGALAAETGYSHSGNNAASYLSKYVAGAFTQLGSNGPAASANDVFRIECDGTTITPKTNGSTSSIGAQTDSAITSGSAGLYGWTDPGSETTGDDWEGGNLGGAAAPAAHLMTLLGVGG